MTRDDRAGRIAATALGVWFATTLLSLHPTRSFDRLRSGFHSPFVPDWRFFAPEPGQWDAQILYRVVRPDGTAGPWTSANEFTERRLRHLVHFPGHREEKGVLDATSALVQSARSAADVADARIYRLVSDYVRSRVRASTPGPHTDLRFQFLIVHDAGADEDAEIQFDFVSRPEPLSQ